jgi:hypothetical protein
MAHARDVGRNFNSVCQTDASDFSQRRVWFLRRLGVNARTDSSLLGGTLQRRTRRLVLHLLATFPDKLIYRRHLVSSLLTFQVRVADFDAQKGAYLPLSGTRGVTPCRTPLALLRPAVSAGCCPVLFNVRDVLTSLLGGCGYWLPSSRNFSVASHRGEKILTRAHALERSNQQTATRAFTPQYLFINGRVIRGRATPPHQQNLLNVALVTFRQLVRNGRL